MRAMAETLAVQLKNILEEYNKEVQQAVEEAAQEAAELTARQLQASSPKKKVRGGKYARGWRVKKDGPAGLTTRTVYNSASPGLTQLLEYGHVSRNQYGTWGRVRAVPHIARAADAGIMRFELAVRARLRR